MSVVTRFAPSPTGFLHIGGARTALYSWLYARQNGGDFRLRIEDTDRERSTPEAVQAIHDGLAWLGLGSDGEIPYQTQRFDRYQEVLDSLIEQDKAYPCYCSRERLDEVREQQRANGEKPRYDGRCRPEPGKTLPEPSADAAPVIRFATPTQGETVIDDLIKGETVIPNSELDDLIIARSDGTPTYNFCVVIDDMDMGVTHVIRGDDHVNNTPRQIAILDAIGGQRPSYGHVPMILGADGKRLSKRHGAVSVLAYREQGMLPEALLNYLLRLGWSKGDQEIFSVDEMVTEFDIARVQKGAATFDPDKLAWVNFEHLRAADPARVAPELAWHLEQKGVTPTGEPSLETVVSVLQDRAKTLVEMAEKSLFLYREVESYDEKAVKKHFKAPANERLSEIRTALADLDDWNLEALDAAVRGVAESAEVGMGKVAQPIRVALTGVPVSPPIDHTLWLLGRERTLARLDAAIQFLST